ncbi:MAG: DinB family protein [Pyrinomonadaceae bacterium]
MKQVLKRLDSIHQELIAIVDPIDPSIFAQRPSPNEWSIAEIVHHLSLVEERVIKDLEKGLAGPPQRIGFFRKLIPTSIVSIRLIRVKAPKAVRPLDAPPKEAAIGNLNRARSSLKELCNVHGEDRLRQAIFKHPFLGDIDGRKTVSFVGYHERRHCKQIREVLKKLRK